MAFGAAAQARLRVRGRVGAESGVALRRLVLGGFVAVAFMALGAGPAVADPAGPTPYDSTVTGIEGGDLPEGLEARVFGGDSYLVLRVPEGVAAAVPGYDEEEAYIRFDADGAVFVNLRSRSHAQNAERFGVAESELGERVDPDAPPDWEQVADDGTYAWHDHRIHWMSPDLPPQVTAEGAPAQDVFDWSIPFTVGGTPAAVVGTLDYTPPAPQVAACVAALAGLVAIVALGWASVRRLAAGVLVVGAVASAWAAARALEAPRGADLEVVQLVLPAGALVGGAIGLAVALGRLGRTVAAELGTGAGADRGLVVAGLGGLALAVLGLLNAGALTQPFLPTDLAPALHRGLVALVLGTGVGALVVLLRGLLSGTVALDLPDLPDLDDEPSTA